MRPDKPDSINMPILIRLNTGPGKRFPCKLSWTGLREDWHSFLYASLSSQPTWHAEEKREMAIVICHLIKTANNPNVIIIKPFLEQSSLILIKSTELFLRRLQLNSVLHCTNHRHFILKNTQEMSILGVMIAVFPMKVPEEVNH